MFERWRRPLNGTALQCGEGQNGEILIKLLYGQINKCFVDYLESGSVFTNKSILIDILHGMDKIIVQTRIVRIEFFKLKSNS